MLETHEIISFSYHDPSTDSLENVDVCLYSRLAKLVNFR